MHKEAVSFLGQDNKPSKEYRCSFCHKLFFKGILENARIEIKCQSCKRINIFITRRKIQ